MVEASGSLSISLFFPHFNVICDLESVFTHVTSSYIYIYWNKRKCLHNKRPQLPQDWLVTPTWPPFHCFWDTNMAAVTSYENAL